MLPIRTERLRLRRLEPADAPRMAELIAPWPVIEMLSAPPHPYSLADAEEFIAGIQADGAARETTAVIEVDGRLAGSVGIVGIVPEDGNLGYWLGQPYWGRGYMSEAAAALVAESFAQGLHRRLVSGARIENAASLRIQAKLGFVSIERKMKYFRPLEREVAMDVTELTAERYRAMHP